ncbi:MAG: phage terminase large subunit [Candidatus Altimarinota bacterium]
MSAENRITVLTPNGQEVVFWDPFEKQIQFHQSNLTNLYARGSRGSGKSQLLRNDAHMRAMSVPNVNMVLLRKTLKDLQKNHIDSADANIRKEMQMLGGYYHGTNYVATYPTGSKLFFSYVGHESDALNLLGAELLALYVDEITTIPWEYFLRLTSSLRVKKGSGLKAVTRCAANPFGESAAEVEKYFVTKDVLPEEDPDYDPDEWGYIQINHTDNPYADVEQYEKRLANLPPYLRKAWLEGEFADEEALFEFHPKRDGNPYHVLEDIDIDRLIRGGRIFRAFDWGWSPDPSYCLWIAHLGNRYIAFHEKTWNKTIIPDIAAEIKEIDKSLGIDRIWGTFCDPSLDIHTGGEIRTNKEIFEAHGIPMECSVNNRELYASSIHHALAEEVAPKTPRLQIYRGNSSFGCPYLVKALPLMRTNPKRPMAMDDHKHDHPVVTLAYFLISQASLEQKETKQVYRRSGKVGQSRAWADSDHADRWILGQHNIRGRG